METNALPKYGKGDNPTGCCPRFHPEGWDNQELHFTDKLFLKAKTRSLFHVPLNMGPVFQKTFSDIEQSSADSDDQCLVLSRDLSPWKSEHYFAVTKDVPGHETVKLTGDFLTRVFEGPYQKVPHWCREMETYVKGQGKQVKKTYLFYTACPKCAKAYGKNHVVAVSEIV